MLIAKGLKMTKLLEKLERLKKLESEASGAPWIQQGTEISENGKGTVARTMGIALRNKLSNDAQFIAEIRNESRWLIESLEKAIDALEFYADKENWDDDKFNPTIWDNGKIDLGDCARTCLESIAKDGGE